MDKLHITKYARDRLWGYTLNLDSEVGGFGYTTQDEEGLWVWYDTFLVPQIVSKSEVDYENTGGFEYLIEKMHEDKVFDDEKFILTKWHSHAGMSAFWSGTDDDANKRMRASGVTYLLDVVVNHKCERKIRLELYDNPLDIPQITLDDIKLDAYPHEESQNEIHESIAEFVTLKTYPKVDPKKQTGKSSTSVAVTKRDGPGYKNVSKEVQEELDEQAWAFSNWDDIDKADLEMEGYDVVKGEDGVLYVMESGVAVGEIPEDDVIEGEVVSD